MTILCVVKGQYYLEEVGDHSPMCSKEADLCKEVGDDNFMCSRGTALHTLTEEVGDQSSMCS